MPSNPESTARPVALFLDEQLFSIHPESAHPEPAPAIEIVVLPPVDPDYPQALRPTEHDLN